MKRNKTKRAKIVTFRLSPQEHADLTRLARWLGGSRSDAIRCALGYVLNREVYHDAKK